MSERWTPGSGAQGSARLAQRWRERAAEAARWEPGGDPEPVLEALALTLALEVTGALESVPGAERDRLRRVGQRALLHVGGGDLDEDEREALRAAAGLARDGLRALAARPIPPVAAEGPAGGQSGLDLRVLIPPSELRRLLAGELDGLAAGALAQKLRRSPEARAELGWLLADADADLLPRRGREQPPEGRRSAQDTFLPLALAAAEAPAVLDPAGGRLVGVLEALGAEAVLFEGSSRGGPGASPPGAGAGRRLAIYAEDASLPRLVADAVTTEGVREGYWVGRVADGVVRLEAVLHLGDRSEAWILTLE